MNNCPKCGCSSIFYIYPDCTKVKYDCGSYVDSNVEIDQSSQCLRRQKGNAMKKTTNEMIEVMQAYEDGSKITRSTTNGKLAFSVSDPRWNWEECDYDIVANKPPKVEAKIKKLQEMLLTEEEINHLRKRDGVTIEMTWKCKVCKSIIHKLNEQSDSQHTCLEVE